MRRWKADLMFHPQSTERVGGSRADHVGGGSADEASLEHCHRTAGLGTPPATTCNRLHMVLRKTHWHQDGFVDFITPRLTAEKGGHHSNATESDRERGCGSGYTDTDYLLAAQATAAEVVTGYSTIDGVDLDAELRNPTRAGQICAADTDGER